MGLVKQIQIERDQAGSLPDQFFDRDSVMVAKFSHFDGEYPQHESAHNCRTYWRGEIVNDHITKLAPVRYEGWRHITTKAGKVIHCPTCLHERKIGFCKDIEAINLHYFDPSDIKYLTVAQADRKKTADRIRQHNNRRDEGEAQITYTTFPLESGDVIFLHDGGEYLGGDDLPTDRAALFNLISQWAEPPKGKRAGHGLKAWAKKGPKVKKAATEGDQADQPKPRKQPKEPAAYIHGKKNWSLICRLVTEYLGKDGNHKGMKFQPGELHVHELIEMLNAAGIDYGIVGQITPYQPEGQEGIESKPTPKPAPILL